MLQVKYLFIFSFLITLTACFNSQFTVSSDFAEVDGIETDKSVYFENEVVGKVLSIKEVDGVNRVTIGLEKDKAIAINSDAVIYLNTIKANQPLEIYNRSQSEGASALVDGQQIQSIDTPLELSAWLIGDVMQIGAETISKTIEAFQGYLSSEEFEQDKEVVQQQIENAADATEQIINSLEAQVSDVIEGVAESESDAIETVEQLTQELAPVMENLGEKGVEVAKQIEQLVQNLEQSSNKSGEQGAVGSGIVTALLEALSNLNTSLEKGAQSGVESNKEVELTPSDPE